MMLPGLLTIGFPLVIAFLPLAFGMNNLMVAEMLGGYMAGVTVSGVLWAIFQNNAGGAWDNAKKSFEAGVMVDGEMTFKGSEAHKAAVTGDTVGDPFKDTSGPSMNILIKLTCLIGLVIAPIIGDGHSADGAKNVHGIEVCATGAGSACCSKDKAAYAHGDKKECCKSGKEKACCSKGVACAEEAIKNGMSKEECIKMCADKGCSEMEQAACMKAFDDKSKKN